MFLKAIAILLQINQPALLFQSDRLASVSPAARPLFSDNERRRDSQGTSDHSIPKTAVSHGMQYSTSRNRQKSSGLLATTPPID